MQQPDSVQEARRQQRQNQCRARREFAIPRCGHCRQTFRRPKFLTDCHHTVCEECIDSSSGQRTCPVCQKRVIRAIDNDAAAADNNDNQFYDVAAITGSVGHGRNIKYRVRWTIDQSESLVSKDDIFAPNLLEEWQRSQKNQRQRNYINRKKMPFNNEAGPNID